MMIAFVLFVVWLGGAAACAFIAGAFSRDDELGSWAFICATWPLGAIAVTVIGPFYAGRVKPMARLFEGKTYALLP